MKHNLITGLICILTLQWTHNGFSQSLTPDPIQKTLSVQLTKSAQELNFKGLKSRRGGDHESAIKYYRAALILHSRFVPAIFNYACELALKKQITEAISQLNLLYGIATPQALRFLAKVKRDPDFNLIRSSKAFTDFEHLIKPRLAELNTKKCAVEQLCKNPELIYSLVDQKRGVTMYSPGFESLAGGSSPEQENLYKGKEAIKETTSALSHSIWCSNNRIPSVDSWEEAILSKVKKDYLCVGSAEGGAWGHSQTICFVRFKKNWYISYIYRLSAGLMDPMMIAEEAKSAHKIRSKVFKRFNIKL